MITLSTALFMGIDGGGTGCRVALARADGRIIGRGESGSANIWSDTPGAAQNIIEAAESALRDAAISEDQIANVHAVLGLAGADDENAIRSLQLKLPFHSALIRNDAEIALQGALGEADGAITIVGTGTIFLRRRGAALHRIGGYGFHISDLGSGARMGRKLLEETVLAYDEIREATPLTDAITKRFGGPVQIAEYAKNASPKDFAALAPEILRHDELGDAIAQSIVGDAVLDIATALKSLDLKPDEPICFMGGLAQFMIPRLPACYRQAAVPPRENAVGGALSLALQRK